MAQKSILAVGNDWNICYNITMKSDKKRENFIKKRKYLFWYVKNPEKVSDEALVEAVLNLGDWDDVQKLIDLLGIKQVAEIFESKAFVQRSNYRPEVKNYFKLYFSKHA